MPFELEANRGFIFQNDRKKKENEPDYTGSVKVSIDGKDTVLKLSGWKGKTKAGKPMLKISLTDPSERFSKKKAEEQKQEYDALADAGEKVPIQPRRAPVKTDMDDEIPF